jgi:hypothetical protein
MFDIANSFDWSAPSSDGHSSFDMRQS